VPLATLDLLARVIAAAIPLFSVVFTVWLSITAADGVASRPAATRTFSRNASWIFRQAPSSRKR
jgi:hypothetical protein